MMIPVAEVRARRLVRQPVVTSHKEVSFVGLVFKFYP